jgi:Rnl2 family RNA ligase
MFKKYPSIENHYRQKHIDMWLEKFPELKDTNFIAQEKIHGANVQLIFDNGEFSHVGSRNEIIEPGTKFYNVWEAIGKLKTETELFPAISEYFPNQSVVLYGELFGGGVQKGVWYGKEQRILFFDMAVDGRLLPYCDFECLLLFEGLTDIAAPIVAYIMPLDQALNLDTNFNSLLTPDGYDDPNICEGIVIKPWELNVIDECGSPFYIKKKNDEFKEKQKISKPKVMKDVDPRISELQAEFESYLTDSRLQNVFSKEGEIDDHSKIGHYIKLVMADAREDFEKDFQSEILGLSKEDQRFIFSSGGKIIVKKLKGVL